MNLLSPETFLIFDPLFHTPGSSIVFSAFLSSFPVLYIYFQWDFSASLYPTLTLARRLGTREVSSGMEGWSPRLSRRMCPPGIKSLRGGAAPLSPFKCLLSLFSCPSPDFYLWTSFLRLTPGPARLLKKDALTSLRDNGSCQRFEGLHS